MSKQTIARTVFLAIGGLLISATVAQAVPIVRTLDAAALADLVGTNDPFLPTAMAEPYNYNGTFTGTVISQAYELQDASGYLYLYQTVNGGPSVLELMAVSPFWNMTGQGYLVGDVPSGFEADGELPYNASLSYDADIPTPNVSFNYGSVLGAYVPAGGHTAVLYLISPNAPTVGEAYAMDSGTAVTETLVPTPEPVSLALLAGGGLLVVLRRRR